MATNPVVVTLNPNVSTLQDGVAIGPYDPRVRLLGGKRTPNARFPNQVSNGASTTQTTSSSPINEVTLIEFKAPAPVGGASIIPVELVISDNGGGAKFLDLSIDGVFVNDDGINISRGLDGITLYVRLSLPASAADRRIRCTCSDSPWQGLVIAPGALLQPAPARIPSSVVFIGDSITEGAVATRVWHFWAMRAALRLGIDNPIVSGVGSTGYISAPNSAFGQKLTFRQRINDVLEAVGGGPPDAVVVAGGINDSAFSPAAVGAEALAYYRDLRAGAPEMPIVVLGPFGGYPGSITGGSAALPPLRDAIFAAAAQVSGCHTVDVTNLLTDANVDTVLGVGAPNGPHPGDAGHTIYEAFIGDAIRKIFSAL